MLARCAADPVKAATVGSNPGRAGVKDRFRVQLPSQEMCRLVSACLAFVCTARTKIVVHVKDPKLTLL